MATFGGVTCDFVKGTSKALRQSLHVWTVPGINGIGVLKLGFQDSEFMFVAVLYGTHSAVVTWKDALDLLQGTIVTATDDWGATHSDLLVMRVSPVRRTPARGVTGFECRGEVLIEGRVTT